MNSDAALGLVLAGVLIATIAAFAWANHHQETVQLPESYAAWEKLTGNPKHLTFQEWRSLVRVKDDQASDTYVPVPIIIPQ